MMKSHFSTIDTTSLAAPEDLKCGECVAVLNEVAEYPSFFWPDYAQSERDELVRVRGIPATSGMPLKIKAICLPFVFVKSPLGQCETIDIRRVQLARLNKRYAKTVWKNLRKQKSQHPPTNVPYP